MRKKSNKMSCEEAMEGGRDDVVDGDVVSAETTGHHNGDNQHAVEHLDTSITIKKEITVSGDSGNENGHNSVNMLGLESIKKEITEHEEDSVNTPHAKSGVSGNVNGDSSEEAGDEGKNEGIATAEFLSKEGLENVLDENTDVMLQFDSDTQDYETVIVMNKKSKFNARIKPDTTEFKNVCDQCDAAFRWPHQLKNHMNFVHKGKLGHICKLCGKTFEHLNSLRDHKYVHTDERPYTCTMCDSSFKMRGGLNKHMRDIHQNVKMKFKCEYCSRMFKTKEKLVSHFVVHSDDKSFSCDVCGKKFNRKNNLKEHRIIHSVEKNFECKECGKKFNRKYSLKIHQRNHLEVRPYQCDFCERSFSQSHALKSHIRLHTGERPYKCRYCERSFKQVGTLQVHEKRHTGEKNFTCGICQRSFIIHRRLQEHLRIHTGEKPYSCDHCPYKAATTTGLRCHKKTHERQLHRQLEKNGVLEKNELDVINSVIDGVLQGAFKPNDKSEPKVAKVKRKRVRNSAAKSKGMVEGGENDLTDNIPKTTKGKTSGGGRKKKKEGGKIFSDGVDKSVKQNKKLKTKGELLQRDIKVEPKTSDNDLIDLTEEEPNTNAMSESVGVQTNYNLKPKKRKYVKRKPIHQASEERPCLETNAISIREKLFAKSLLTGTNLFSPQSTGQEMGLVQNDGRQNDLSSIDVAIANLANSIKKNYGGVGNEKQSSTVMQYHSPAASSVLGSMLVKIEPSDENIETVQIESPNSDKTGKRSHIHVQEDKLTIAHDIKEEPFDLDSVPCESSPMLEDNTTNSDDVKTSLVLCSESDYGITTVNPYLDDNSKPLSNDLNFQSHDSDKRSQDFIIIRNDDDSDDHIEGESDNDDLDQQDCGIQMDKVEDDVVIQEDTGVIQEVDDDVIQEVDDIIQEDDDVIQGDDDVILEDDDVIHEIDDVMQEDDVIQEDNNVILEDDDVIEDVILEDEYDDEKDKDYDLDDDEISDDDLMADFHSKFKRVGGQTEGIGGSADVYIDNDNGSNCSNDSLTLTSNLHLYI